MSFSTTIEWTDTTWNPVRGCTKVSAGCKHCYAERFSERFRGVVGHPFENGFDLKLIPGKLADPLRWVEPRMIFVNSMSDLFHPLVPDTYIARVLDTMSIASWHTYQVLTKRSERLRQMLSGPLKRGVEESHIWWGVSVEDRRNGLSRIQELQQTPVSMRFLSVEPLLEDLGPLPLEGISWVIAGGESGPGARTLKAEWVVSIREQCIEANIPFFFKQWGGVRKKKQGRTLDGRIHNEFPKRTANIPLSKSSRLEHVARIHESPLVQISPTRI